MADDEKPRVRTLETPMMPDHVRVPTIPPSHVAVAAPEPRNYVHNAHIPPAPPSATRAAGAGGAAAHVALGMAIMLVLVAAALAGLAATGHVTFR